jgi:hypothetical protein
MISSTNSHELLTFAAYQLSVMVMNCITALETCAKKGRPKWWLNHSDSPQMVVLLGFNGIFHGDVPSSKLT